MIPTRPRTRLRTMAYSRWDEMEFGQALHPVTCGLGITIGGGQVIPEVKYAPRPGKEADYDTLRQEYAHITEQVLERAVQLGFPGLVLELEHVFQLTDNPAWGAGITARTKEQMVQYHDKYGIPLALRVTIADIRRPEHGLREGSPELAKMLESFERCAAAGADILSIESIGGKEVFNHCVTRQDIAGVLFAVGVLGSADMEFLWERIVAIANAHGVVPGGDTDCAHANSAMFLAGGLLNNELPHTFAALVRAIGAARSLVAFECGATGPDKDCGYEGPVIKAITGCPISMEGKSSACAHSDLMGNIAAAVCDLWSNEAVQYGDMFGGTTPAVFTEILGYDAAQFNAARALGYSREQRDILIHSDRLRDPQAFVISPDVAYEIGKAIVSEETDSDYRRARAACLRAGELIQEACAKQELLLTPLEKRALSEALDTVAALPDDEEEFLALAWRRYQNLEELRPASYGFS